MGLQKNEQVAALRDAGLPLARAHRYGNSGWGLPLWARATLMGGVLSLLAVIAIVGLATVDNDGPAVPALQAKASDPPVTPTETSQAMPNSTAQDTAGQSDNTVTAAEIRPTSPTTVAPQAPSAGAFAPTAERLAAIRDGTATPELVTRAGPGATGSPFDVVAAPAPADAAAPSCVSELTALGRFSTINFDLAQATPDEDAMQTVINFATLAKDCPAARIIVEGHSDSSGPEAVNLMLSWRRADAVIRALQARGFDVAAYEPMGFGARFSLSDDATSPENDPSRRVEFRVVAAE